MNPKIKIDEFIDQRIDKLRTRLVKEFNDRSNGGKPLRYKIADSSGEGEVIQGFGKNAQVETLKFQDVLNSIDSTLFEEFSALVLKRFGCKVVFTTPSSHDQGVDAFGVKEIVPIFPRAVIHPLVFIAQAKHYKNHAPSTNAIREIVGAAELLLKRVFSTVNERYTDLDLKPYGPTALVLIASQEMSTSVRRLVERAGVFVLETADLYELFKLEVQDMNVVDFSKYIQLELKSVEKLS